MLEQALSDVRVVDLTWHIAGPYCTKLLADYGADVIKVERPGAGDPARRMSPFLGDDPHPEKSGLFLHLNTNKRGITLNLKSETGKRLFKKLVKDVDILVESFSPRVMPSLGLEYETLTKINPRLVMTSISNFGQTGPYRDYKASDIVEFAMGGPMYQTGIPEREPLKLGGTVTTTMGGNIAAAFTMGALFASRLQEIGQHVDMSLFEAQAGQAERRPGSMMSYRHSGHVSVRQMGAATLGIPYAAYPCKDGFVRLMTMPGWWPRVAQMIGKPEIISDPRFAERQTRLQHRDEFDAEYLLPWLIDHTKREVTEAAQAAKEACAPINTPEDLVNDPHLSEREFFVDINHPVTGVLKYPGAPFKMMETPWRVKRPAPLLGQHNNEVYGKLGYSRDDLVKLKTMGTI